MINIRPLIEQRIKTQVSLFKEVAGAASLTDILKGRKSGPGCYIFKEQVTTGSNDLVGAVMQKITERFAVVIVVQNVKDSRGADAADASWLLQSAVNTALLGWPPHSAAMPMEYSSGTLISFVDGFFIWKDTFQTSQYIRSL